MAAVRSGRRTVTGEGRAPSSRSHEVTLSRPGYEPLAASSGVLSVEIGPMAQQDFGGAVLGARAGGPDLRLSTGRGERPRTGRAAGLPASSRRRRHCQGGADGTVGISRSARLSLRTMATSTVGRAGRRVQGRASRRDRGWRPRRGLRGSNPASPWRRATPCASRRRSSFRRSGERVTRSILSLRGRRRVRPGLQRG
jgi:hypothetical protein